MLVCIYVQVYHGAIQHVRTPEARRSAVSEGPVRIAQQSRKIIEEALPGVKVCVLCEALGGIVWWRAVR